MSGSNLFRQWSAALCAFFCVTLVVPATTVIAPPFETLVDRAELIFTGQVLGQRSEWKNIGGQKSIVTFVSFTVQRVHKGRAGSVVTLQFLGGSVGDVRLDVADMPAFKAGERVVLFVEGNGSAISPIIGFFHGKFSLKKDESGRDAVMDHKGEALADVKEIGVKRLAATPRRALSHDEFASKIRERLATSEKK